MIYDLKIGMKYKTRNLDDTYMYFKVIGMASGFISIYIYRDDDTLIYLRSGSVYHPEVERCYLSSERVSKLSDAEYLAMML